MAYSTVDDLLLGDLPVDPALKEQAVSQAADDIDAKLGVLYALPLAAVGGGVIPAYQLKLLKGINNKLASGRLLMTLNVSAEAVGGLHSYGKLLLDEANQELLLIANGVVTLDAVRRGATPALDNSKLPAAVVRDTESLVEQYENGAMRGIPSYARPGDPLTARY